MDQNWRKVSVVAKRTTKRTEEKRIKLSGQTLATETSRKTRAWPMCPVHLVRGSARSTMSMPLRSIVACLKLSCLLMDGEKLTSG